MITTKPATVFDLFNGHPERWTKGALARDADGNRVYATDRPATRWCIAGAVSFVYYGWEYFNALARLKAAVPKEDYVHFNDDPSTTFDMMLAKVKEAGI